jgi:peptidoglycan/LPS O-acetylase OafA/YrhL
LSRNIVFGRSTNAGRLDYIDGLRAVAVLLVMFFHARVHAPGIPLNHFFLEGTHGVDLFFVLSGFCLSAPTLQKLRREGTMRFDLIGFAAKRFLRIFPPYAVAVVAFGLAGTYALSRGIALPEGMLPHFDAIDVASELLFLDRSNQHLNQSFWSLAIEFRWYFIFPLMLALWVSRARAFVTLLLGVALTAELTRATSTDLGVLPAFMLGIVAAHIRVHDHPFARFAPQLGFIAIFAALGLENVYHFPIQTNPGWHVVAFALVVAAGREHWLQRALSWRGLSALGVASYSIYLVHEPIVSATMSLVVPWLGFDAALPIAVALGLTGGVTMWAIVERPLTDRNVVAAFVVAASKRFAALFAVAGIPPAMRLATPAPAAAPAHAGQVIAFSGRDQAAES